MPATLSLPDDASDASLGEPPLCRFVPELSAPIGPIHHFVSLGTSCYANWIIKTLNLKRRSYPLDWCFSSPEMVIDVLADDFAKFLDPVWYRTTPLEERTSPPENVADHGWYRDQLGINFVFNHKDVNDPAVYAYYVRAVARFRRALTNDENTLLLMVSVREPIRVDQFERVCALVDGRARNTMLLAVNAHPKRAGNDNALPGSAAVARRIGHHRLIDYHTRSPFRNLEFEDIDDDLAIYSLVTRYARDPRVEPCA